MQSSLKNLTINQMFQRIEDGMFDQHKPEVLSKDPWIVYFDEMITPKMADDLVQAFHDSGEDFAASSELDLPEGEGALTARRTSLSMFCNTEVCQNDPRVLAVHEAVGNVTGLPLSNQEYMQVVKYNIGQYYVKHHDTSATYSRSANGHRIYTMFLYLHDVEPDAGGETSFPDHPMPDMKVRPKKGGAALWTNVVPDDPDREDFRTMHEALPLKSGNKMGANLWMYAYDWREIWRQGCANQATITTPMSNSDK
jgi:prolyl 4-hydroxylase